jgi:restriction system protein
MGVVQLAIAGSIAAIFIPAARQMLFGVAGIIFCVAVLVGIVALGVFLIRRSDPHSPLSSSTGTTLNADLPSSSATEAKSPQTTAELLERLRSIDWFQFEKLVGLVYRKLGYRVTRRGGANPDRGIDLVIEKDGLRTAVQCKQWKTWNVGVKAVREFLGALTDAGIPKGIFITLCGYTGEAKQLAQKHGIEIVNEIGLARMLEATSARFDAETLAILCDTRKFCPRCESEMVLRSAGKGNNAGSQFWGCSSYPKCRYTMPI